MSDTEMQPTPLEKMRLMFAKDTAELMRRPEFRRWVLWLIDGADWTKARALTFDSENARLQDYGEGRRSVGVQLLATIQEISPELFMRALNEQPNLRAALNAPIEKE